MQAWSLVLCLWHSCEAQLVAPAELDQAGHLGSCAVSTSGDSPWVFLFLFTACPWLDRMRSWQLRRQTRRRQVALVETDLCRTLHGHALSRSMPRSRRRPGCRLRALGFAMPPRGLTRVRSWRSFETSCATRKRPWEPSRHPPPKRPRQNWRSASHPRSWQRPRPGPRAP